MQFLDPWVLFGLSAQFVYFLRFFIQWLASEKSKKVVVPIGFWYLSIAGAAMVFVYSVHKQDIVFMLSGVLSIGMYIRNLMLHNKHQKVEAELEAEV